MKPGQFVLLSLLFLGTTAILIAWVDRPLAAFIQATPGVGALGKVLTSALEWLVLIPVWKHALAAAAVTAGVLLYLLGRAEARIAWFVAATLFASHQLANVLKGVFGRLRPLDQIAAGPDAPMFFIAGNESFPSGHTALYFGLCLPLALCLPRWRWPLLALASVGGLSRVFESAHYPSDVLASAYMVLAVALLLHTPILRLARRIGIRP